MTERRKHPRYDISVQVSLRLVDTARLPQVFDAQTVNVCREGVAIAVYEGEETMRLLPPLLSEEQLVELKISLPPTGEWVTAIGQARWYDIHSYEGRDYLRVGIFLKQMDAESRRKWEDFWTS